MTRLRLCACRPGCLSRVFPDDEVVTTVDGEALRSHVAPDPFPVEQPSLFDTERVTA